MANKITKTHYITVRVVFDKPCDSKDAIRWASYGLKDADKLFACRPFHAAHYGSDPTVFQVKRVMPK